MPTCPGSSNNGLRKRPATECTANFTPVATIRATKTAVSIGHKVKKGKKLEQKSAG